MPLPLFIAIGAGIAAATGVGAGIHGGVKMKEASDTAKSAQRRNKKNADRLEDSNKKTMEVMDVLGRHELEIVETFKRFSAAFEKIKNAPNFNKIVKDDVTLSSFTPQEIKKAAVGASVLLGGLGGAALGTAGGFAAAGGTTAAVMALGTASTGTAISALSGAAATNATLAALGGGSLAAGGGGMALGTAVLGGATLGVGLLIGGIIFSVAGSSVLEKADQAWNQMIENEKKINSICDYLKRLENIAKSFHSALSKVNDVYMKHLVGLESIIEEQETRKFFLTRLFSKKVNYNKFSTEQKKILENTVLLVSLLYEMCKVKLVEKNEDENELNKINENAVNYQIENSKNILSKISVA